MVFIVLRSGKVIQYNDGGAITVEDGTISVRTGKEPNDYLVARIPLAIVERAEFSRPCAVYQGQGKRRKQQQDY